MCTHPKYKTVPPKWQLDFCCSSSLEGVVAYSPGLASRNKPGQLIFQIPPCYRELFFHKEEKTKKQHILGTGVMKASTSIN